MKEPVIVGYDPGTTAALAIMDTNKNLLILKSKRNFKKGEIIDTILETGRPILVAADRNPMPRSVSSIAKNLNCSRFYPSSSLTSKEKSALTRQYGNSIKNDHERDAVASAVKACIRYSTIFRKTRDYLRRLNIVSIYGDVLEGLISGEFENLSEAVKTKRGVEEELSKEKRVEKKQSLTEVERNVEKLKVELKSKEADIKILKNYIEKLKKTIGELEKKRKLIKKPRYINKSLNESENEIRTFKEIRKCELEGKVPVINVELDPDVIRRTNENLLLKERAVFSEKSGLGVLTLNDYGIKALITGEMPEEKVLEKVTFPIVLAKDISLDKRNDIFAADGKELDDAIAKARKGGFLTWVKGYKKRRI